MSVQLQDRFNEPTIAFPSPTVLSAFDGTEPMLPATGDGISRIFNPGFGFGSGDGSGGITTGGGLYQIVQQLMSIIAQLLGGASAYGNQQYFTNASGGSNGDPHLSFNGSTWNDMQSEGDLLDSNSIPGGFRISTQTTTPNASGVTYNQQATVTTNFGNTRVSLDKNGNASYTQYGVTNTLAAGQSINLGNGESATLDRNGVLTITQQSPQGGCITTTMSQNGNGVNVNVTANDVDLGGALVSGANGSAPQPQPQPTPIPGHPIFQRY